LGPFFISLLKDNNPNADIAHLFVCNGRIKKAKKSGEENGRKRKKLSNSFPLFEEE
jgi:hypothetical protein